MFINISSDRIFFLHWEEKIVLPFWELEKNLSDFLYKSGFSFDEDVVVLNGPWSFTNIRIGTLALNTYAMLHNFPWLFLSIDKIQFYKTLYIHQKVPRYCLMFIGQKKNYWIVDLEGDFDVEVIKNKVTLSDLEEYVKNTLKISSQELFCDELVWEWKENTENILSDLWVTMYIHTNENINFVKNHLLEKNILKPEKMLEANYMIEANIS